MRFYSHHTAFFVALGMAVSWTVNAAESNAGTATPPTASTEQVVIPEVARRDVSIPRLPSNDFEAGVFAGTYSMQNFGSNVVTGLRIGYHITEDFFAEAVVARTKVSDDSYRQILPSGIFPQQTEKLRYYNLSAGYNVLPAEVFIGGKYARPSALYVIGGVGSTNFTERRLSTLNFGAGFRVYPTDHLALQIDAREHLFSLDILGKRQSLHNLELTFGITASF